MVIKPAIGPLNTDPNPKLIINVSTVLTCMLNNINYVSPTPTLPEVQTALDEFHTAVDNAAGGGVILNGIVRLKRKVLVGLVRQLALYVQMNCKNDLLILQSSGFAIQKPKSQPVGPLPVPSNFTVSLGGQSGQVNVSASPVTGASIFNWRVTTAEAPTVVVQTAQTPGASYLFTGLTPQVKYNFQVNVVGPVNTSDWSVAMPLIVV